MAAVLIDGKARAAALIAEVQRAVAAERGAAGRPPGLAVILVGEDPASQVYVRNKAKAAAQCGFTPTEIRRPAEVGEEEVVALVDALNSDPAVDGILVQLPLPAHIDARRVIERIAPEKDVDGLTVANAGRLALGAPGHIPCTPQGAMILIKDAVGDLSGARAVVVGRSILVGKPMGALLLGADATPTMAHSKTRDLGALCREADIIVAAVGRPHMIKGDWVKPGACVIDVGINRVEAPDKGEGATKLVGDVDFEAAAAAAGAITPVPGGVGPMTIACLMANAYRAWAQSTGRTAAL